jgi:hypothetical protein
MNRAFKRILFLSLALLCLAITHPSQTRLFDNETGQQTSSLPKQDLSTWQNISLEGKGIKFKLPLGWRHEDSDMESKHEKFAITAVEWNKPNQEMAKTEMIRIFTTTIPTGFLSFAGTTASKEEMAQEKFDSLARDKENGSLFTGVKKVTVSGVEGVFRVLHINSQDKDIGVREGILWTGYRFYQGNAQEIDITISANPTSDALLRTIFGTLELEHDKDARRRRD